jgi:thiamine biosynthesis lipoprotein
MSAVTTAERPGAEGPAVYRVRALGTTAELMVTEPGALVAAATLLQAELARLDLAASRFRADSEVARIDCADGQSVVVSPLLIEILEVALRAARATDGLVDPTVGQAMTRIGYDRDFSAVPRRTAGRLPAAAPVPGWRSVEVDKATGTVRVPSGTRIDVGATAKAWSADRIAASVFGELGCGVLVSLGGDVAVAGPPPPGCFRVGLGDVCGAAPTSGVVAIASGGLATSGVAVRQWYVGDQLVHHIVDPATGLPVNPWWRTVTVVASSCVEANTASTAAMVMGPSALAWLEARQLPARLVSMDGTVARVAGWPEGELTGAGPDSPGR